MKLIRVLIELQKNANIAFPDLSIAYKNCCEGGYINPLSANIPKWSETLEK